MVSSASRTGGAVPLFRHSAMALCYRCGMVVEAAAERTESEPAVRANLWPDRDFVLFFVGQGVSGLGTVVSITALPLLVLQLTGSGVGMATVATLQSLPPLFLGLLAGGIADRWDRRRIMIACD